MSLTSTSHLPLWQRAIGTDGNIHSLIVRVVAGGVMLPHGMQKTVGLFGGHGFSGTMEHFTTSMGIPWLFALAAILAESLGALALIFGFLGRLQAFAFANIMIVAVAMGHYKNGFFMNWFGNQAGEGFEYHLLMIGLTIPVMIAGSGAWSIDHLLTRLWSRKAATSAEAVDGASSTSATR